MPLVYTTGQSAAGANPSNQTTSGTTNTEVGVVMLKPATAVPARNVSLFACYVQGMGNALTAISGIKFRIARMTTASTAGSAVVPSPADAGAQAATATAATGQTISVTGRTNHVLFGCGAAGPGGWVAPNPDAAMLITSAATLPSLDMLSSAVNINLVFDWSVQHQE